MCKGNCKCANLKEELEYYKMIYDKCVAFSQDLVRSTMRFQPLVVSENDFDKIEKESNRKLCAKTLIKWNKEANLKKAFKKMDAVTKRKPTKKQIKDLAKVIKKK